jgi:hypothetical protein
MTRAAFFVLMLALQGCSGLARSDTSPSACAQHPASYACQVENYQRAP